MSQVASAISQKETHKSMPWRYSLTGDRDLRIDFMRGIALVMMVVAHTEVMSIFNIFSWERFGLTTGAEGFVILSGFMLGMLNRVRLQKAVLLTVSWGLYLRAWKIYQVNIIIIVSFLLLRYLPYLNVYEVTHFTDRFSGTSWSLYPLTPQIKETWFNIILYLQIGPHQTQILGLYIFLLLLSPLFLGMLQKGHVYPLLGASLLIYGCWQRWPIRVTPCEFDPAGLAIYLCAGHVLRLVQSGTDLFRPHAARQSRRGGAGVHRAYPCVCRPEPYQSFYAARAADARNPAGGF